MEIKPVNCNVCGRPYRADKLKQCPGCSAANASSQTQALNFQNSTQAPTFQNSPTVMRSRYQDSNNAVIAIESAHIVNGYGTFIQIVGIFFGVLIILGGFFFGFKEGSLQIGFLGLIFGLLSIATFAIQGALFRMISNYVIARLSN